MLSTKQFTSCDRNPMQHKTTIFAKSKNVPQLSIFKMTGALPIIFETSLFLAKTVVFGTPQSGNPYRIIDLKLVHF